MVELRDSGCQWCRESTAGDCGQHGPRVLAAAAFMMTMPIPSQLTETRARCTRCRRYWFWNGEQYDERSGAEGAIAVSIMDANSCPVCSFILQRRFDDEYRRWIEAGSPR